MSLKYIDDTMILRFLLKENKKMPISEVTSPYWKKRMEANKPFSTWTEFQYRVDRMLDNIIHPAIFRLE